MREREEDLAAALRQLEDRRNELIQDRARADQRIAQLGRMHVGGRHPSLAAAEQERDSITAVLAELDSRIADLRSRRSPLLRRLEDWLRSPDASFDAYDQPLPSGEWTIDTVREQVVHLQADIREVEAAPLPSGVVKQRIRAQVAALAERGCPNVGHAIEVGAEVAFSAPMVRAELFAFAQTEGGPRVTGFAQSNHVDPVALAAWLFHDELVAKLEGEVDAQADDSAALTDEDRAARCSELRGQVLALERVEEGLVEVAEVARRKDADPRAVLGLD